MTILTRLGWLLLITILSGISGSFSPAATKPNIILLVADDLRFDALGFTGNRIVRTPALDQLARQGTRFRNSFVTTSICCISRASILSGQSAQRHGITDFDTPFTDSAFRQTYPALLCKAGYFTGFIGKYGVGHQERMLPKNQFDFWAGLAGHGVYWMKDEQGNPIHNTDWMGQRMQQFLTVRDRSKPFCLSVSFKAPHSEDAVKENGGFLSAPAYDSLYRNTIILVPFTNQDRFYDQFPARWKTNERSQPNEGRVRYQGRFDPVNYQSSTKAIYRLVSGIDTVVGQLVERLRRDGLLNNTIILFTSDNGFYQGEHGLSDKWYGHNESIRVPLLIMDGRRPLPAGQVRDAFALNIDLAPTLLTYAGLPVPVRMQGRPLQTLLNQPGNRIPAGWRTEFLYEHRYDPGSYPVYIPMTEGVVTQQVKYMRYFRAEAPTETIHEELFAWQQDSLEIRNLATEARSRTTLYRMRQRLDKLRLQNR